MVRPRAARTGRGRTEARQHAGRGSRVAAGARTHRPQGPARVRVPEVALHLGARPRAARSRAQVARYLEQRLEAPRELARYFFSRFSTDKAPVSRSTR